MLNVKNYTLVDSLKKGCYRFKSLDPLTYGLFEVPFDKDWKEVENISKGFSALGENSPTFYNGDFPNLTVSDFIFQDSKDLILSLRSAGEVISSVELNFEGDFKIFKVKVFDLI